MADKKATQKEAKVVAKKQDDIDGRIVMRSSYNSGVVGTNTRHGGAYEYDRQA
mgnify:CR=1 FL=1